MLGPEALNRVVLFAVPIHLPGRLAQLGRRRGRGRRRIGGGRGENGREEEEELGEETPRRAPQIRDDGDGQVRPIPSLPDEQSAGRWDAALSLADYSGKWG